MSAILDGLAHFGCSLAALPDHPLNADGMTMRRVMAKRKLSIPTISQVADTDPLPAWIQQGMLVVSCPACAGSPDEQLTLIWRDGPHLMLCIVCGNAEVGGSYRKVSIPEALAEIEAALACRPAGNRTWRAGETVDDLLVENERFGWAPLVESEAG